MRLCVVSHVSITLQGEQGLDADYYLTTKDIFNMRRSIEGLEYQFCSDQATSMREFKNANPELVLCYQEYDPATDTPFFIGVTTPDLLDVAVRFGHGRPASMDSTFATNNLKASLPSHSNLLHGYRRVPLFQAIVF